MMVLAAAKYVDVSVLRNVFAVALVAGVGVTVLFSVTARSLAAADSGERPAAAQRVIAGVCGLVMIAAVAVGIWAILAK